MPQLTSSEVEQALGYGDLPAHWDAGLDTTPWREVLSRAGVRDDMLVDNHSHGLNIGPIQTQANATPRNLRLDLLVLSRAGRRDMELVTNSRMQPALEQAAHGSAHVELTQLLLVRNVPNYLTPKGPYHPVVDEVRSSKYLVDFRRWISSRPVRASRKEVDEMSAAVEAALQEAQEEVFVRHLDSKRHYTSIGKAMVGDAIGLLFPVSGTLSAIAESTVLAARERDLYWQGFLVGARRSTRRALPRR